MLAITTSLYRISHAKDNKTFEKRNLLVKHDHAWIKYTYIDIKISNKNRFGNGLTYIYIFC